MTADTEGDDLVRGRPAPRGRTGAGFPRHPVGSKPSIGIRFSGRDGDVKLTQGKRQAFTGFDVCLLPCPAAGKLRGNRGCERSVRLSLLVSEQSPNCMANA